MSQINPYEPPQLGNDALEPTTTNNAKTRTTIEAASRGAKLGGGILAMVVLILAILRLINEANNSGQTLLQVCPRSTRKIPKFLLSVLVVMWGAWMIGAHRSRGDGFGESIFCERIKRINDR